MHRQRGKPRRWHESYFQFTPVSILLHLRGPVPDHIFISQLCADARRNISQVVDIQNPEHPPSRHLANIVQQNWPQLFFRRRRILIKYSDRVNLHIALPHHSPQFSFGIPASVIAAIGDNQQRLPFILRLLQLVHAQINRVDQRRPVLRLQHHHPRLNIVHIRRVVHNHRRPVVEPHHEKLILRIRCPQKFAQSLARPLELRVHAPAQVEDDPNGHRSIFRRKTLDHLSDIVVVNLKIFLLEASYQPVHRIGHRRRHQHQIYIHPDPSIPPRRRQLCGVIRTFNHWFGIFRTLRRWWWRRRMDVVQRILLPPANRAPCRTPNHQAHQHHCKPEYHLPYSVPTSLST